MCVFHSVLLFLLLGACQLGRGVHLSTKVEEYIFAFPPFYSLLGILGGFCFFVWVSYKMGGTEGIYIYICVCGRAHYYFLGSILNKLCVLFAMDSQPSFVSLSPTNPFILFHFPRSPTHPQFPSSLALPLHSHFCGGVCTVCAFWGSISLSIYIIIVLTKFPTTMHD